MANLPERGRADPIPVPGPVETAVAGHRPGDRLGGLRSLKPPRRTGCDLAELQRESGHRNLTRAYRKGW